MPSSVGTERERGAKNPWCRRVARTLAKELLPAFLSQADAAAPTEGSGVSLPVATCISSLSGIVISPSPFGFLSHVEPFLNTRHVRKWVLKSRNNSSS